MWLVATLWTAQMKSILDVCPVGVSAPYLALTAHVPLRAYQWGPTCIRIGFSCSNKSLSSGLEFDPFPGQGGAFQQWLAPYSRPLLPSNFMLPFQAFPGWSLPPSPCHHFSNEKSNLGGTSPAIPRCIRFLAIPALTPGPAVAPTCFLSVSQSGFPTHQQELEGRKDVFISIALCLAQCWLCHKHSKIFVGWIKF